MKEAAREKCNCHHKLTLKQHPIECKPQAQPFKSQRMDKGCLPSTGSQTHFQVEGILLLLVLYRTRQGTLPEMGHFTDLCDICKKPEPETDIAMTAAQHKLWDVICDNIFVFWLLRSLVLKQRLIDDFIKLQGQQLEILQCGTAIPALVS